MRFIIAGLIFLGGFLLPIQAAVNFRLSTGLSSPVRSSVVSFLVGLVALGVVMVFADGHIARIVGARAEPSWLAARSVPWWAFLGGLCGAFYVLMSIIAIPRIGAIATIALALLGQQIAAIVIDTFGLFGVPKIPLALSRVVGVALVATGVLLVQWKK